jgi:hypothetical protein
MFRVCCCSSRTGEVVRRSGDGWRDAIGLILSVQAGSRVEAEAVVRVSVDEAVGTFSGASDHMQTPRASSLKRGSGETQKPDGQVVGQSEHGRATCNSALIGCSHGG